MRIATFLPHVGVFGGVRRFLELGNAWVDAGHDVTLFHPAGRPPEWLPYRGRVRPLSQSRDEPSELAITADSGTYGAFRAHDAITHLYYCVLERDPGLSAAIADHSVRLAANSGPLLRTVGRLSGRTVIDGIGGIRASQFYPDRARRAAAPLRILLNGRRSKPKKGTDLVLAALRGLVGRVPPFEVILFDSVDPDTHREDPRIGANLPSNTRYVLDPTQDELVALYQSSHVFVAAERKAGWCNTALESLACGCALVCTRSGTTDFAAHERNALVSWRNRWSLRRAIGRLLTDEVLRSRLASAGPAEASRWDWSDLATKILSQVAGT